MSSPRPAPAQELGSARPALAVLAVSVFAAVTTELLPVGLLPQIGSAFDMRDGTAGLLVSAYAVIGGYVVSNVVSATAPTFGVLAAGRVVGGITHALFFSVCIGYSARLVPVALTGRAMALVSVGASGGLVLGVPLSTAVGTALGWRVAFGAMAVLVALVLLLAATVLPPVDGRVVTGPRTRGDVATWRPWSRRTA